MKQAILFKILQRQSKFKNPDHLVQIPEGFKYSEAEYREALSYLNLLVAKKIEFTYPGHTDYPKNFYRMKNPPLFLEYKGRPLWNNNFFLGVVGSRKISQLSKDWMSNELKIFLESDCGGIVSGGAYGVDQWSHLLALKSEKPTVIILPCGLEKIYPVDLVQKLKFFDHENFCFMSEFELQHSVHKSFFFHRNRLIAAMSEMLLVVEAQISSGTMLTVHHSLENGKPILTLPSHPELLGFSGNLKLLNEGAVMITCGHTLLEFWHGEMYSNSSKHVNIPTNSLDQRL